MKDKYFVRKLNSKLFYLWKKFYQIGVRNERYPKTVFIVGCQRSGTSLLLDIFDRDLRTTVFRENSIAFDKQQLRPLDEVEKIINDTNGAVKILKPLLDSHRAEKLLTSLKHSYVIWIYRHYRAVAKSSEHKFSANVGVRDLLPIVSNDLANWRNMGLTMSVRKTVCRHFSERMNPLDAAALFWWARNNIFFDRGLDKHGNVHLCNYEKLVSAPSAVVPELFDFVGLNYRGKRIIEEIHDKSVNRGMQLSLDPSIESLCGTMMERLDQAHSMQISRLVG